MIAQQWLRNNDYTTMITQRWLQNNHYTNTTMLAQLHNHYDSTRFLTLRGFPRGFWHSTFPRPAGWSKQLPGFWVIWICVHNDYRMITQWLHNHYTIITQQWLHNDYTTMITQQSLHNIDYTTTITQQWLHNDYTMITQQWLHNNDCTAMITQQWLHNNDCTTMITQQWMHNIYVDYTTMITQQWSLKQIDFTCLGSTLGYHFLLKN